MNKKFKRINNILHIADIHFGKKNDSKLYQDLLEGFINRIPEIQKEFNHIDAVIIEGDLFDRVIKMSENSSMYVIKFMEKLCEMTKTYGFYLRLIRGTKGHDYNQLRNFIHMEESYPLFKIINTVSTEDLEMNGYEYSILYLPEEYPENYDKYYKNYLNQEYDYIFGHGMIDFVSFTGDESVKRKITRNEAVHKVDTLNKITNYFVIFGHIHDMMNYKNKDKIMYVGSFERFSFADQEVKGFLLTRVDPETGDTEVIFYENENASVYNILNLDDYEFETTEDKIKFIDEEKKKCDYLKVIINKDEENKELLKGVLSSDIKIESHNKIPEDVVDERFMFLIKRELPLDQSIKKYIQLTINKDYKLEDINKYISN